LGDYPIGAVDVLRKADKLGASTLVGKLPRILQQQYRAAGRFKARVRRVDKGPLKMSL
jgi:hypothetical protein